MEDEAPKQTVVMADEELRLLEAMAAVSRGMQQMNQVLSTLNRQTVELSRELATAERQMVRYATAICYDIRDVVWWLSLHAADLSCIAMCVYEQNALYLPFQAAIYEMQSSGNSSTATAMTPAAARYTD